MERIEKRRDGGPAYRPPPRLRTRKRHWRGGDREATGTNSPTARAPSPAAVGFPAAAPSRFSAPPWSQPARNCGPDARHSHPVDTSVSPRAGRAAKISTLTGLACSLAHPLIDGRRWPDSRSSPTPAFSARSPSVPSAPRHLRGLGPPWPSRRRVGAGRHGHQALEGRQTQEGPDSRPGLYAMWAADREPGQDQGRIGDVAQLDRKRGLGTSAW